MAIYVLPEVVKTFSERRPRTRLVLVNRHSGTVAQHVLRGDLDLGIVTWGSGAEPPDSEELEAQMLFQEQFVLAVPTGHSLAGRADVELEELRREALLQLDPQTRTGAVLRNIFASAELEERVVLDSGSFEVIKRYVEAGVGIALLPKTVMTRANAGLAVASVARVPPTCIGAIWRRGVYRSRGELEFLDLVRSAARGLAG
jgi:DNA-binding transcriptional LysR family regulator